MSSYFSPNDALIVGNKSIFFIPPESFTHNVLPLTFINIDLFFLSKNNLLEKIDSVYL